ncbi:MAG: ATP-binding protein [Polyangiales bacterium]
MSRVRVIEITAEDDRYGAAGEARRFAAALGFASREQARVAVCVAELASNVAKHAGRGRIELSEVMPSAPLGSAPRIGCRVCALDDGPGISAIDDSLRDGFSEGRFLTPDTPARERRGLGAGLGAVVRLMSEVTVVSPPGGGVVVEAVLWGTPEQSQEKSKCSKT